MIEAFASYSLSDKNLSLVLYNTIDNHPLSLFVMRDCQKWDDLLLHSQVESVLFITKNQSIKLFHPQLIEEFDPDSTRTVWVEFLNELWVEFLNQTVPPTTH